jgi:hypothetical protein
LAYLKHHLSEFEQFAFSDAQDEENEFAWPFVTRKHHFIDFSKIVSFSVQKADYELLGPFT